MCSFIIVVFQPYVQIRLQLCNIAIEFLAERDLVKLLQDRLVKSFTDSVCLRAPGFSFRVIDVFQSQVELVFVVLTITAVLGKRINWPRKKA